MHANTTHTLRAHAALLLALVLVLAQACASTKPLPQPRRVVDPSEVPGAVQTDRWSIAAVEYEYPGKGLNYEEAGLEPVYLVFRNHSPLNPEVRVDEVRGVTPDGSEYLAYSLDEATALVFASESFSVTASNAARTGALGAVLGASLGALIGTVGGGDNIWKGAAIGGVVGGMGGAATQVPGAEKELKRTIRDELRRYAWDAEPIPSQYTKVGYLYLPGDVSVQQVRLVVRAGGDIQSYTVDVVDPGKAEAAQDKDKE